MWDADMLGGDADRFGAKGSPTRVAKTLVPGRREEREDIQKRRGRYRRAVEGVAMSVLVFAENTERGCIQ